MSPHRWDPAMIGLEQFGVALNQLVWFTVPVA